MHKRYLKIFMLVFGLVIFINTVSTLMYLNNPKSFYFRPWEYFDEVAYKVDSIAPVWDGQATSDQTRKNHFYYQDAHGVLTTVDHDGYRSQPPKKGEVEILVSGDSTIFGSGLSDHETLPWILSGLVNEKVSNGGRSSLFNTLQKPEMGSVRIVIDGVIERVINDGGVFVSYGYEEGDTYQPLSRDEVEQIDLYQIVPPARYLATSIMMRKLSQLKEDVVTKINGGEREWVFNNHTMRPSDLESAVRSIKQRHEKLASENIRYIFMAIPSKQTLYDDSVDVYTRTYIHLLSETLQKEGIEVINLLVAFEREKSSLQLYRNYDTHWNENGTRIAAEIVAEYLQKTENN